MSIVRILFICTLLVPYASIGAEVLEPGMAIADAWHISHGWPLTEDVDVGTSAAGDAVFAWSGSDLRARIYDVQGNPLTDEILVDDDGEPYGVDVAVGPSGKFVVFWKGVTAEDTPYFRGQRFDSDGTRLGEVFAVFESERMVSSVSSAVADDASVVVAWAINEGTDPLFDTRIYAQRYDAAGDPIGTRLDVSSFADAPGALKVASFPDGGFVVTWQVGDPGKEIMFRRFDAAGNALTDVTSVVSGAVESPLVAADRNGGFVIAWLHDSEQDKLLARKYSEIAEEVGALREIAPPEHSQISKYELAAAAKPTGGFVFAWASEADGTWTDYYREFDSGVVPVGSAITRPATWWTETQLDGLAVTAVDSLVFAYTDVNLEYVGEAVAGAGVDLAINAAVDTESASVGDVVELELSLVNNSQVGSTGNAAIDAAIGRATGVRVMVQGQGGVTFQQISDADAWQCAVVSAELYECDSVEPIAAGETAPALTLSLSAAEAGDKTVLIEATAGNTGDSYSADNAKEIGFTVSALPGSGGGVPGIGLFALLLLAAARSSHGARSRIS